MRKISYLVVDLNRSFKLLGFYCICEAKAGVLMQSICEKNGSWFPFSCIANN